jgi:iron complex transport system ATP-binding protein
MMILQANDVGFRYTTAWVLREVSFGIDRGEVIGIIGPNGSGKTTLLKVLDGILVPQEGQICLEGVDIRTLRRNDIARSIAVVPQEVPFIFPFRVEEIVTMGRSPHLGRLTFEGRRDFEIVREVMAMTGIEALSDRRIYDLSGGERQLVWIARALAQQPRIILLDEFTAFLDIRHQIVLFELIKRLNEKKGLTVVVVTHDINLASQYAHRIILLNGGRMHALGRPEEVITESHLKEVYEADVLVDSNPINGLPRVTLIGHPSERGSRLETGAAPQL